MTPPKDAARDNIWIDDRDLHWLEFARQEKITIEQVPSARPKNDKALGADFFQPVCKDCRGNRARAHPMLADRIIKVSARVVDESSGRRYHHFLNVISFHFLEQGMSKAFVNEDAEGVDEDLDQDLDRDEDGAGDDEVGAAIKRSGKNYVTAKGFETLKSEWSQLLTVERPKVVEVVAWAASNGDRSENADYTYGKKRLREIDRRLRFLQRRMDLAEVVVPEKQSGDRVLFGATVTVLDESENERLYRIVGVDEIDAKSGKVSWVSPIGQALLQTKVGDVVQLHTPKGEEELEILKIEFKPID